MSAHKLAILPLQARIKSTINLRPTVRGLAIEQNLIAKRVVEYLHARILENPEAHQTYHHDDIGAALGIDPRKVRLGLAHAGGDAVTVEVTPKCRSALKKALRTAAKARSVKRVGF